MKPYAESCDQNRDPIFLVLAPLFSDCRKVLEIASGTGQHAVYFAEKMPHLIWQTSDLVECHPGINAWLEEANLPNTREPLFVNTRDKTWAEEATADAVFTANSLHIMHWKDVEGCFTGVGQLLPRGGLFAVYGPFNYHGAYTSESNARFDAWLKSRDQKSGIRDFSALDQLANQAGMTLNEDVTMPANNRILCWRKK